MAWSSCPKCSSHNFEVVEKPASGLNYNLKFVQCLFCGAVVGVFDNNTEQRLNELEKKINGSP